MLWNKYVSIIIRTNNRINHCVKLVCIRNYSGPYFPTFDTTYLPRIQSECGKMRTRITPYKNTFCAANTEGQKIVMIGECPIFANVELATKPKSPVKVANFPGRTTENI